MPSPPFFAPLLLSEFIEKLSLTSKTAASAAMSTPNLESRDTATPALTPPSLPLPSTLLTKLDIIAALPPGLEITGADTMMLAAEMYRHGLPRGLPGVELLMLVVCTILLLLLTELTGIEVSLLLLLLLACKPTLGLPSADMREAAGWRTSTSTSARVSSE